MTRTALVAGGTGLTGSLLLRQLAADPDYVQVRAMGRRAPAYDAGKIRLLVTGFDKLEGLSPELAVDDVFCCLGTTLKKAGSLAAFERVDYHMVVDLARAAHKAGARQFIVMSAAGTSATSPAPYSRVKARMEAAVSEIPFEAVHILRPSLILGSRAERRPAEHIAQIVAQLLSPLLVGPLRKYRAVQAADIASAMITVAKSGARGVHVHHLPL